MTVAASTARVAQFCSSAALLGTRQVYHDCATATSVIAADRNVRARAHRDSSRMMRGSLRPRRGRLALRRRLHRPWRRTVNTTSAPARPIPPEGPRLQFSHWAQAVYRTITLYVPDVHAQGTDERVSFSKASLRVDVTPEPHVWRVYFHAATGFSMPPLAVDRHDDFTARCVAETIVGFFDPLQSTPKKTTVKQPNATASPSSSAPGRTNQDF